MSPLPPPSGVREGGNWPDFVFEFVKMKNNVREFVNAISFVIRDKIKYRSRFREFLYNRICDLKVI